MTKNAQDFERDHLAERFAGICASLLETCGARQVVFGGRMALCSTKRRTLPRRSTSPMQGGEVILAYSMNGADLPLLNGFPLRLVVLGYLGTYWVKHINEITVLDGVFDGFWMKSAYRIPDNECACAEPGTSPKATIPINRFNVRSFITNLSGGAKVKTGSTLLKGIAFDGARASRISVSIDGGATWLPSQLGKDLGNYSFREWQLPVTLSVGPHDIKVRATNQAGQTLPDKPLWNPPGQRL